MKTHRRQTNELNNDNVILFAENGNEHYGPHVWTLAQELPQAGEDEMLLAFAAEFYGVDNSEAYRLVNPAKIVDSAGAWDDPAFVVAVSELLDQHGWPCGGWETTDGAAVIDAALVQINH